MNIKKTVVVAFAALMCVGAAWARPHGGGARHVPHHGGFHHYRPPVHHYHHHGCVGRSFWGGVVGGVVGGVLYDAVTYPRYQETVVVQTTPTVITQPVVTQPVVVQQTVTPAKVWVEGRYVDQVQANGSVIRVWQPGHYE